MALVKESLGDEAVILHTRAYKKGGFFGFGAKEVVEVTAAIDDAPRRPLPPVKPQEARPAPVMPRAVLNRYQTAGTAAAVAKAQENVAPPPKDSLGLLGNASPEAVLRAAKAEVDKSMKNLPPQGQQGGAESMAGTKGESQQQTIDRLQKELADMKAMLVKVASGEREEEDEPTLQQVMEMQGVSSAVLDEMMRLLPAGALLAEKGTREAQEALTSFIAERIPLAKGLETEANTHKVAALIGPTGVGKTTTLAKIAARSVLEDGIPTALITADTYRVSAVEQLRTYADILDLPLEIVYTPQELQRALEKFQSKPLVLVDTAGRSQNNRRQMQELSDLLNAEPTMERYLVMSVTTKDEDAADILERFAPCRPDKMIFTKTDETRSLGIMLNLLYGRQMPLAYFTNGQSVPDDIMMGDAAKLAELLLR